MPDLHQAPRRGKGPAPSSGGAERAPSRRTKALALFTAPDEEARVPTTRLRLDGEIPDRTIHLDFEIHSGLPGATDEWQARAQWLGHLNAHAKALAALAVDRTEGETRERAILVAERLGTLLKQGTTVAHSSLSRLDLAAPLPQMKPWPPVFAGEPASPDAEAAMTPPLRWSDLNAVAAWARQLAYFLSGLHGHPPQAVQRVAVVRLRRLVDAAAQGLVTGRYAIDVPPPTAKAPGKHRAKRGGST